MKKKSGPGARFFGVAAMAFLLLSALFAGCAGGGGTASPEVAGSGQTLLFQGQRYPSDTETLTLTALTEEEARSLDSLPGLKQVDGTQCSDLSALAYLQRRRPECQVLYQIPVCGTVCASQDRVLTVTDGDAGELAQALDLLPRLECLTLEGTLPECQALQDLQTAFPELELYYTLELGGQKVDSHAQTLDLAGSWVTYEELEAALPLLRELEEVNLIDTNLTQEEYKALAGQFPEVFFGFIRDLGGKAYSTDATELDFSGCPLTLEEAEEVIRLCPKLQKLILSNCGIPDEMLDDLNRRYPEISVVWTVKVGIVTLRTDAKTFFPGGVNENRLPNDEQVEKLRYCTELVAMDLGHAKITQCTFLENLTHLKYLILADTQITDLTSLSNLKELVYLEIFKLDVEDYSPLLGCTALQDLNISFTQADPAPLGQMTWLHNLHWNGGAEIPGTQELVQQLPQTNVVLQTDNPRQSIGGMWRYLPNYYVFRSLIGGQYLNQGYTARYWGQEDARKILACDKRSSGQFVADVLAQILRQRIDSGESIVGIRDGCVEKAEILYQTLCDSAKDWSR